MQDESYSGLPSRSEMINEIKVRTALDLNSIDSIETQDIAEILSRLLRVRQFRLKQQLKIEKRIPTTEKKLYKKISKLELELAILKEKYAQI